MPFIVSNGVRHYYRLEGCDDRPILVLVHSLGCDHTMWDWQVSDVLPYFRVLRYDVRGHGATDCPSGDYSIPMLAEDALGVVDGLGIQKFAYCGLSLGGMIGQRIAATQPHRITGLILANTSARFPDTSGLESRRRTALDSGMAALGPTVMGRFFSETTLAKNLPAVAGARHVLLTTNPVGYAGCSSAIRDMDQVKQLSAIAAPTLIIVGDKDVSTPWDGHGEVLAREIPNASAVRLPAAHLSNIERPRSFSAAILKFFVNKDRDGMRKRREVLGDAHVDKAIAATTDFTRDFQQMITEYAWGAIWQRPGLDDRTRRLLVLTATAALGRWEEFRLHVRAGLERELETCDIEEALLQAGIYAGVPAANTGFQIAVEEIARFPGE